MSKAKIVYGVGIYENGAYPNTHNGRHTKEYSMWCAMFERCYSALFLPHHPTYLGCAVDKRFHKFQDFMSWASKQVGFTSDDRHLDKDILVKGNKIYGPDTCAFVPKKVNNLIINRKNKRGPWPIGVCQHRSKTSFLAYCTENGVQRSIGRFSTPELAFEAYKKRKEEVIKRSATNHRYLIDENVYLALINYEILITD